MTCTPVALKDQPPGGAFHLSPINAYHCCFITQYPAARRCLFPFLSQLSLLNIVYISCDADLRGDSQQCAEMLFQGGWRTELVLRGKL